MKIYRENKKFVVYNGIKKVKIFDKLECAQNYLNIYNFKYYDNSHMSMFDNTLEHYTKGNKISRVKYKNKLSMYGSSLPDSSSKEIVKKIEENNNE